MTPFSKVAPLRTASPPRTSSPRPHLRSALCILLLLATSARSQTPDLLAQAKALIRQNRFTSADPILRSYIVANPHSSEALYLLGFVLHRENKPKDSLAAYTAAAAITPPQSEDLRIVALDYVLLDDYPDAIRWLNRAVASDPRNSEAWYDLGRAQMNQGNFVEAERDLRQTLSLSPGNSKTLDNLGLSLEAQNRAEEALSAYTRAITAQQVSPHASEEPLLNLGTLLNARTKFAEAVRPLEQAVLLAPKCARCHEELSRAYIGVGQNDIGLREMEQACALDPSNPRFHYQLGQMYRRAGMPAKADAELKRSSGLYGSHSLPPEK